MKLLFKEKLDEVHKWTPRVQFVLKLRSFGVKWRWRGYWYGYIFWEIN